MSYERDSLILFAAAKIGDNLLGVAFFLALRLINLTGAFGLSFLNRPSLRMLDDITIFVRHFPSSSLPIPEKELTECLL